MYAIIKPKLSGKDLKAIIELNVLAERIGIPMYTQIAVEFWNELLLILLILTMIFGAGNSRNSNEMGWQDNIPFTKELIIFYSLTFLYNLCDIMDIAYGGTSSDCSYVILSIGVFCYYFIGGIQTLFFLQVIKNHIAEKQAAKKAVSAVQVMQILNFIMLSVTPFTGCLYYIDSDNNYVRSWGYMVWQSITIISFVFIGAVLVLRWNKTDSFMKSIIATAVIFPLTAFIGSMFINGISLNNIMTAAAALIIFIFYERNKTRISVQNVRKLEQMRTQLAESRLEAEHSKIKLLVAQIQPHFIYNSIMALQSRSVNDPVLYEGIEDFGKYLRANFEAMTDNALISFEDELKNIKAYLRLERLNFGDRLKVEYDIEIDRFILPALSVEPLVENAVRYGIGTYENGGLVKIIVRDETDCIYIEVLDDGSGKSRQTDVQKKRKSIGIENVRLRLKAMDMGELSITGGEHGTSAVIRLKYKENENENNNN